MRNMFCYFSSLESLNLNNFNADSLTNINSMFGVCKKLESLEIKNLDTKYVTDMKKMFFVCAKLTTLNLINFNIKSLQINTNMFYGITQLIYCINKTKISEDYNLNSFTYNCAYFCLKESKKYILEKEQCIESCSNDTDYGILFRK